jgi:NADPH2:quinone reductase
MKAAWYERNGPANEVFVVGDWPEPTPTPGLGEVRVKLATSGVNPSDVKSRASRPPSAPRIIAHSDGAGIIESVGAGVDQGRIGQRVWIWNGQWQRPMGTCAQYIVVPADQAVELDANTDFAAGACLGIPALTAYQAIELAGDLTGKTVLVIGAANGVGLYAAQMAKFKGARVIGTVGRADKANLASAIGVEHVINYKTQNTTDAVKALTEGRGADVIVDMDFSGLDPLVRGGALKRHGTVVCYGSNTMTEVTFDFRSWLYLSVTLKLFLVYDLSAEDRVKCVRGLGQLLAAGKLTHQIGLRFGLDNIAQAHEAVEQGLPLGNVVIDLD